ncbi:hypothetical protein [Deinococcus sp. PESE-13]
MDPTERQLLEDLFVDGGWLAHHPPVPDETLQRWQEVGWVTRIDTAMGEVIVITAQGRKAAFGSVRDPMSIGSTLDMLYLNLCLSRLGWEKAERPNHLRGLSRWGDLMSVRTSDGTVAFVAGQVTGRGISPEAIRRLGRALKSTALAYNLTVILLTPHPRRGQQAAREFANFLELRCVNPRADGQLTTERGGWIPSRPADQSVDAGPLLTPSIAAMFKADLPPKSRSVLQQPRAVRVAAAERALLCDHVLSEQQLQRHYGLDRYDMARWWGVRALVRPVHGSCGLEVSTTFVCLTPELSRLHDGHLAHLAGVAEMRHEIGITPSPNTWTVEPRERHRQAQPDAVHSIENGDFAIEYDNGSYADLVRERKIRAFNAGQFNATIWGVPHATRQRRIEQNASLAVITVQWWQSAPWQGKRG